MASETLDVTSPAWLSVSAIPLRPAPQSQVRASRVGRIPLVDPRPAVPGGQFDPTAFDGEAVPFAVTAFREGHDRIGVHVRLTSPSGDVSLHRLTPSDDGTDRWETLVVLREVGAWGFAFEGFADEFATWRRVAEVKLAADIDGPLVREQGALLLDRAAAEQPRPAEERRAIAASAAALRHAADSRGALAVARDAALERIFRARPLASLITTSGRRTLVVEPRRAGVGAWYELFPRSEGATRLADGTIRSGSFRTAAARLPAVAAMGFDVVYLPPIHPIGTVHRKGPNNTLAAGPNDPGSPWAIGSADGGHDAVNPDLGTVEDFRAFVASAAASGMDVALDLALQAAPDHPWVTSNPQWFTSLPDGSIAYAENPPKKYQDIYPLNFDDDPDGLSAEVLRVVRHWIAQGVRIFRVDNPHTKPLWFWEWLIRTVETETPGIVFLAEAFTRPAPLRELAKAGFQQSYTYFTWRNTKDELEEFLSSLAHETADFLRPNLFVNTPDILTEYLQFGGRAAYKIRAAIAATAAPTYGVYAGYELIENVARPGSEENLDNEKYEYKIRDWDDPASLAPYLTRLNAIRRAHPALGQLRNLRVQWSDSDAVLVYVKHLDAGLSESGVDDTIIVVANTDPHSVRETTVHLDTTLWGVPAGEEFDVEDLVTGSRWTWRDHNYVRLDAFTEPVHILHVRARA